MTYIGPENHVYRCRMHGKKEIAKPIDTVQILSFDPGGTTGWSRITLPIKALQLDNPNTVIALHKQWIHGQIDCFDQESGGYSLCKLIDDSPTAAVVYEDFNVRQLAVDLSPAFLISKIKQHLWYRGRPWFKQSASQAKRMTDDRLKLWAMYNSKGGLNHARDADRHLILFVRKLLSNKELRKEAWPSVNW